MSILNLLGVDHNSLEFDGKSYDKVINNIASLSNNKYEESNIELANDCLSDINSEASSLDSLEDISNNVENLRSCAEDLFNKCINTMKDLMSLEKFIGNLDINEEIKDEILERIDYAIEDVKIDNTVIHVSSVFKNTHNIDLSSLKFDFIPHEAVFSHEWKPYHVVYSHEDWTVDVKTFVNYRGTVDLTGYNLLYKDKDYFKAYNKIIEVGIDPHNLTKQDGQLLSILDNQNKEVYSLFIKEEDI